MLKFLPAMAQIILPVTMSILQKKLYKSILAKNPELIKSIVGPSKRALGKTERTNLNNILMQLRKCLAHPFVYSTDIEERSTNHTISHRNLVEASSKLQLLEIMLPKLQERGHRVLIFSQFLDMLDMVEDFLAGLGLFYQRLDGSIGSLQKQKRIDEFNAPDSPLFAFLLSTRAGGVGINLATADTVIILDPDFNPHQDIQALSRAHRIGQKKKVLVFQLTTRNTAEEKIMQIGKKKMALDHVLIEQMDAEDDAGLDLESILKYGTEALFKDDDTQDIHYDSASVDRLLDRSQIEDTKAGSDDSAESQFSFARVWANDKGVLEDNLGNADAPEPEADPSIWENILKEREREAAAEAAARAVDFGRGRRKRQVSYSYGHSEFLHCWHVLQWLLLTSYRLSITPRRQRDIRSCPQWAPNVAGGHKTRIAIPISKSEMRARRNQRVKRKALESSRLMNWSLMLVAPAVCIAQWFHHQKILVSSFSLTPNRLLTTAVPVFKRAQVPLMASGTQLPPQIPVLDGGKSPPATCPACGNYHVPGRCPLKVAGVEYCPLCGIAHFGRGRICPHINSITQLQAMLEAIKHSTESAELKELAKKKLTGLIGSIRQKRRQEEEGRAAALRALSQPGPNSAPGQHPIMDRQVLSRQINGGKVAKAH